MMVGTIKSTSGPGAWTTTCFSRPLYLMGEVMRRVSRSGLSKPSRQFGLTTDSNSFSLLRKRLFSACITEMCSANC